MPVAKGVALDPARTRAAIMATATDLLYERGLDGIGVAELCAAAGVSKETLYRHFGSKDGLVAEVLQARSDLALRRLTDAEAAGAGPEDQLAAMFDALARWHADPRFRGCAVVNAAAQRYAGPARGIAVRHLDRYLELLTGLAARAGAADPAELGRQLLILVEGAITVAANQDRGAAEDAKAVGLLLLKSCKN